VGILLDRFRELPEKEAENALETIASPSADRTLRLALTRRLTEHESELDIPWVLDRELVLKLAEDPDPEISALIKSSQSYKNYETLEKTAKNTFVNIPPIEILPNAMPTIIDVNNRAAEFLAQQLREAERAATSAREIARAEANVRELARTQANLLDNVNSIRSSIVPTWYLTDLAQSAAYLQSFLDHVATVQNTLASIGSTPDLREALSSLRAQAPRIVERVVEKAEQEEGIEEIGELTSLLEQLAHDLTIFHPQANLLQQAIRVFRSGQFVAAHSALVNIPEGLLRAMYQETGLGGASDDVSTMAQRLRANKYISKQSESLVKAIERDKTDHALRGEQDEFPEHNCRLVLHCLLRLSRDYVYHKSLRKALVQIVADEATYKRSTMEQLLNGLGRIERLHVERQFTEDRLVITITLFRRDVFKFSFSPPDWDPQKT
jgi:hypothetical protein